MDKYRIRLQNGRIVGPFEYEQVLELNEKGHLNGSEECQTFPVGQWAPIISFKEFSSLFSEISEDELDKTSIRINIGKKAKAALEQKERVEEIKRDGPSEFNEFKIDSNKKVDIAPNYDELEKKFKDDEEKKNQELEKKRLAELEQEKIEEENSNKTRVLNRNLLNKNQDIDKTRVINPKQMLEDDAKEKEEVVEEKKELVPEIDSDMKTQFIKIEEYLPELKGQTIEAEKEIEQQEKDIIAQDLQKKKEAERLKKEKELKAEAEAEEEKPKTKKLKPIIAIAFLAIIFMFMFDDDDKVKEIEPRAAVIEFPIINENEDPIKSIAHLKKGIEYLEKDTYESKIFAQNEFKQSLSNKFQDNEALGYLILTQALLFPDCSDKPKASVTISTLMQIAVNKSLSDVNVVVGSAIFYSHFEKYNTAVNTIEKYIRATGRPSLRMFSYLLRFLMKKGDPIQARVIYEKLKQQQRPTIEAVLSMTAFLELDQRLDEAQALLEEVSKSYSNSVPLLLEYAKYALRNQDLKKLLLILDAVKKLEAEKSPVYFSKYLEFMGILSVINKDNAAAAVLFNRALKINDSDELRSKLAALDVGGGKAAEELISESKAVELMGKAKLEMEYKNWQMAFNLAIEAVDLSPNYIPAQLLLADVELKRGYFSSALEKLDALLAKYPLNKKINIAKGEALLASFKFDEAKIFLGNLSGSPEFKESSQMASLMARYYDKSNSFNLAARWYAESINRNPVDDLEYFRFSRFYFKFKKFAKAKDLILKAIALYPQNVDYHCAYAEILYELESVETALGYLRNLGLEFKDDPKILGDIAKYYYRSGQNKQFEETKEKIDKALKKDPDFYEFLIESAKKDDRAEDVVKYSQELIKIKPGDLSSRMILADFYVQKNDLKMALKTLEEIKSRLNSYPKLNYYLCKIYLELKDTDKALVAAQDEIKYNPSLEGGFVMEGEVYKALTDFSRAEKSFEKAVAVNPKASEPLAALGWLKFRMGHIEAARELYIRAITESPNDPMLRYEVGKVYKAIGQSALAIESFQAYLKLRPDGKEKAEVEQLIRLLQ